MDQILSQLLPAYRIGSDGFQWWIGQIEDTSQFKEKVKGSFRYKVRIVGVHVKSCEINDVKDLPWAQVMMPVTSPMGPTTGSDPQLTPGQWVIGFYLDYDKQKPIIMGQLPQQPGATQSIAKYKPGECNAFSNYADPLINPAIHGGTENGTVGRTEIGGQGEGNGGDLKKESPPPGESPPQNPPNPQPTDRQIQAAKEVDFCTTPPDTCEKRATTFGEKLENVVAEMLLAIQSNGGNLGDYLVNRATGEIYGILDEGRIYINRALVLLNDFIANAKGWVIDKLEAGVKDLINNTLGLNKEGSVLNEVTKWFNGYLIEVGCSMEDLGKRLADWLTNLLMGYITQVYRMIACQVDKLVQGILNEITKALDELLGAILGPLQEILGAIAEPLNIIGDVLNKAMTILGITCTGPNLICENFNKICTNGSTDKNKDQDKEDEKKKNFLDDLLDSLEEGNDKLFPVTNPDYTIYTCDEAYEGNSLSTTSIGFTGGVFAPPGGGGGGDSTSKEKIVYSINDIMVTEGEIASFTITRSGTISTPSSILYQTADGTANDSDYLESNGIIGFSANEIQKTISVQTFFDTQKESEEDFFVILENNTPIKGTGIVFAKKKGRCIIKKKQSTPDNIEEDKPKPFVPEKFDPDKILDQIFDDDNNNENNPGDKINPITNKPIESYIVTSDKSVVKEGDFVIYTIETSNVTSGTIVFYTLTGSGITQSDIVGGALTGFTFIEDGIAQVTIGIEDDTTIELEETMRFSVDGKGAYVDVTIITDKTVGDLDDGIGSDTIDTVYTSPEEPIVDPTKIITDDNGGIISIPINKPGSPYVEPPFVFINGTGKGASAVALLDDRGFVTEVRVTRSGVGYKKNLPSSSGVRCIMDSMTLIRPGIGYKSAPLIYINGRTDVAEAIINEKGFVIGARILDRTTTFDGYPEVFVIGGEGFGAKLIPSFVCLDTDELTRIGSTKIGTGRYVDCP